MSISHQLLLENLFQAAINEVQPKTCMKAYFPDLPEGKLKVVGAGKAAAEMARVAVNYYDHLASGVVITRYGHGLGVNKIGNVRIVEAGHPIPDTRGVAATRSIIELAKNSGPDDVLLCLLSGGGSALLTQPPPGILLAEKQTVTSELLACGAAIDEINCVRKHLSDIKGGRLALAARPAKITTLAISDVSGDTPSSIASGPTVGDPTTFSDARAVLTRYGLEAPASITKYLGEAKVESPKPEHPTLSDAQFHIIASAKDALKAAAKAAKKNGFDAIILGDDIQGEARKVAKIHANIAQKYLNTGKPTVLISGGETTVKLNGSGAGGPNTEYALALSIALHNTPDIYAIACDTDGIDGSEDNAGATIYPDTILRAQRFGLNPHLFLENNDSYSFFKKLDNLVVSGPTLTNVNDFRAILILPGNTVNYKTKY